MLQATPSGLSSTDTTSDARRASRGGAVVHSTGPRMIEVSVPVRICDNGGWTDTWFGGPGRIVNIAVTPGVVVSIRSTEGPDPVVFDVEAFGDRYPMVPRAPRVPRHALLEAAL